MKRILAAVDFSSEAARIIKYAAFRAQNENAELIILHALTEHLRDPAYHSPYVNRTPVIDFWKRKVEKELSVLTERCLPDGIDAELIVDAGKPIASSILSTARARNCSLIVLSRSRPAWLDIFGIGEVLASVLRAAPCPVVVLQPGWDLIVERDIRKELAASSIAYQSVLSG